MKVRKPPLASLNDDAEARFPKQYKMDDMLFWQLENCNATKVVEIGSLEYYSVVINCYRLMFAIDTKSARPLRMYLLNDNFAKCLGFYNYLHMRNVVKGIQYWRKMITTKAIKEKLW